ncbi:MAG: histidinol dehydrogenase [Alphaproteobacteria bacterium]
MVNILNSNDKDFQKQFDEMLNCKREMDTDVTNTVAEIIESVKSNGDTALFEYTKKFDNLELNKDTIRFSENEINDYYNQCDKDVIKALEHAHKRIYDYHIKSLPTDINYNDDIGVGLGIKYLPVESAGLYVPGGTASYPSSVLMNVVPAKVAGVKRLAITVPTPNGEVNPYVIGACKIAGVNEIYKVGGAQAIGALAYGTESIAPVVKITGPGNAFVANAKRQVFGKVGIDMIAGPSEVLIVADNSANPNWVAYDLMAQAEHDVSAQSILITDNQDFANSVMAEVDKIIPELPRAEIAKKSWEDFGTIIVVDNFDNALPLIDAIASEHLQLCIKDADTLADKVSNAGAIFIGNFTPEAIGDYIGGTNHVLPTARSAKYASGLGVMDFMKRTSILKCDEENINQIGEDAILIAQCEGLDAHAKSIAVRLKKNKV